MPASTSAAEGQVQLLLRRAEGDAYTRSSYVLATRPSEQAAEPTERLEQAVEALTSGVTKEEESAGLTSAFAGTSGDPLERVRLEDGQAVIDFTEELRAAVPSAGTSNGGTVVWAQLLGTAFTVPEVQSVTFHLAGDCPAFYALLEQECETTSRATWEAHPLNPAATGASGG